MAQMNMKQCVAKALKAYQAQPADKKDLMKACCEAAAGTNNHSGLVQQQVMQQLDQTQPNWRQM